MWKFTRYLLTGLLASLMVVDSAAAGRLFRRMGCPRKCHCACVRKCPTICCEVSRCVAVDVCGGAADSIPVTEQGEESSYYGDVHSVVGEPMSHERLVSPTATDDDPTPAPDVDDLFDDRSQVITPPAGKPQPSQVVPAPVAVPTTPATVDAPAYGRPTVTPTAPRAEEEDDLFAPTPVTEGSDETNEDRYGPDRSDDLFDEPTPAADEPATDHRPAEEKPPVESTTPEKSDAVADEELFGVPSDDEPVEQAPESDEAEKPEDDEQPSFDDLFGNDVVPAVLRETGGLQSSATRTWTDDTAQFHCEARLSRVTPTAVLLLKSHGGITAVPLARLSTADLRFVQRQVGAMRDVLAKRGAVEKLASAQGN